MSTQKLKYIKTPITQTSIKTIKMHEVRSIVNNTNTGTVLLTIALKHKYGLVMTWAVVITLLYLFPFLPDLLATLV